MYQSHNKSHNKHQSEQALRTSEKVLLSIALLAIVFFVWDWFWLSPLEQRKSLLQADEKSTQQEIKKLTIRKDLLERLAESGPDASVKIELQRLNRVIEITDQKIEEISIDLSMPENAADIVQMVLSRMQGLSVQKIVTLPEEVLSQQDSDTELVRQGFELSFEGSFNDTMAFLQALENSGKLLYWETVRYQLTQANQAAVKLTFFVIGGVDD